MKKRILLAVLLLCGQSFALTTVKIRSKYGNVADSIKTWHLVNSYAVAISTIFVADSAHEDYTLYDGADNQFYRLTWFYGDPSPLVENWPHYDQKLTYAASEPFRTPCYWMDPIDSFRTELWYDQSLATQGSHVGDFYSFDTSWTAYPGKINKVYYDIYFSGQPAQKMEFLWAIDTTCSGGTVLGPAGYVSAYIDVGSGWIDSLTYTLIPRNQLELVLFLVSPGIVRAGNTAILSREWPKRTDASGRARWVVPANNYLTPAGRSFYELTYRSRDQSTYQFGIIRRFILDSAVTNVNILDAQEVR